MMAILAMLTGHHGEMKQSDRSIDDEILRLRRQLNLEAMGLKRATILARNHLMEEVIRPPGARRDDEVH